MKEEKISAVVVVRNGEKTLETCLKSLEWVDEIVVIDDESTDDTVKIAKKYTDKVYTHKSEGYVEPARNFAIEKASNTWVLILDADEEIPEMLSQELKSIVKSSTDKHVFVKIPRKNIIFSKWIEYNEGWWPDYQIRFFKKGSVKWKDKIHSIPETQGIEIVLEAKESSAIIHENYPSVNDFVERLNRYTTIEAKELKSDEVSTEELVKFPIEEFISRYYSRNGWMDGSHGLILAVLEMFYSTILRMKIWEESGAKDFDSSPKDLFRTLLKISKEFEYWHLTYLIENEKNVIKKLRLRAKRKRLSKKLSKYA